MTTIRYRRHFQILILAAITLTLSSSTLEKLPAGDVRFFSDFALVGALHATSLVISLRHGIAATLRIAFVALAAVLSAVTIAVAIMVMRVLDVIPAGPARLFLFLLSASALGASGYWLLVRWFWLKSLRRGDLIRTVALCMAATMLSWGAGTLISLLPWAWSEGMLRPMVNDIIGLLPTAAWWAAFSGSLYWSEVRGHGKKGKPFA